MRVSVNELEVRYTRALQGLGVPIGIAADASWIVAWHDMMGWNGLGQFLAVVPALDGQIVPVPNITKDAEGWYLDAKGASLFVIGPGLVDTLEMAMATQTQRVTLYNARDTGLLVGCADMAARRGVSASWSALDGDAVLSVMATPYALDVSKYPGGTADAGLTPDTIRCVVDAVGAGLDGWWGTPIDRLRSHTIATRLQDAVDDGVAVDDTQWQTVLDLGKRGLVNDTP